MFAKIAEELRKRMASNDSEAVYYQDALMDTVGEQIKHDFVHFNWQWLNERKKRYNWGQLNSNLLLIGQAGNNTPCHFDEQHNFWHVGLLHVKINVFHVRFDLCNSPIRYLSLAEFNLFVNFCG